MLQQILIGIALILLSVLVSGVAFAGLGRFIRRFHDWVATPPHAPRVMVIFFLSVTLSLFILLSGVVIWTVAFRALGLFDTAEASFYFAIVCFTTLGFGDVLLPEDWRLLSGFTATNGFLSFGFLTAMLVEIMRDVRIRVESAQRR